MASNVIAPQPAMIAPRLPSGLEAVASFQTVPVRFPAESGINLICMLTNQDLMQIDSEIMLPQLLCAGVDSVLRVQQV